MTQTSIAPNAQCSSIGHHFTVDVEEYFQVSVFDRLVRREDWDRYESRVTPSMARLLDLLDDYEARATFFVLGWLAERKPELVRAIAKRGHEVASHGWDHRRVTEVTHAEFRESIRRTKTVLEQLTGQPVVGFRAPSFSVVPGCEWAFEVLLEEGYLYDSSLFPIRRPGYGYRSANPEPHWLECAAGRLAEFPATTLRSGPFSFPAAGGGYFRLLPYALTRAALTACERRGRPGTFYIHPWEVDPEQPRLAVKWLTRLRHYGGLRATVPRLKRLLEEFRFRQRMVDSLGSL